MEKIDYLQLNKLKKKQDKTSFDCKAAMMGDCATQHLSSSIVGYGIYTGLNIDLLDIDYNLIDAQVLDEHSELFEHNPDFIIIYMCTEKMYREFTECKDKSAFAENKIAKIKSYWSNISSKSRATVIQYNFVEKDDSVFGNYALKTEDSFFFQIQKLNYLLSLEAEQYKNVYLINLKSIAGNFGISRFYDDKMYYIAKMPISLDALPVVAKNTVDAIRSIRGSIKKCVICDLDNTLWGGVIGDDGIEGIQIGELGLGHAFEDVQTYLKSLKDRGIILGVCSKNDENTAKEPFIKHPDMILRLDDFAIFVANWEDKASNIRYIQQTLNIGMDSIVFLDDNPFERNLVKTMIPDICVPELPEDPALYLQYLKSLNLFETASYSANDKDRTAQYQSEVNRIQLEQQFASYDEYLENLDMIATVSPFDDYQTPRIAQLSQRSNQFNLRTVRYTEADVQSIMHNPDYFTLYFMLKDKFGDHGLISLIIMQKQDEETLFVENWLMSCRVLKRGMEEFVADAIIALAKDNGFRFVRGEYLQTPKNGMVKDLYRKMGFEEQNENEYIADVESWQAHKTYIKTGE